MGIRYRKVTQADIEYILKLQEEWFCESITYGYRADALDKLLSKIDECFWVAECEDGIIGFIIASEHTADGIAVMNSGEKYIEIDDVFVSNRYRDQGVGGRLVDIALEEAHEHGIEKALVYSATKDFDGIVDFYRRHGFKTWYVQMFK